MLSNTVCKVFDADIVYEFLGSTAWLSL